MIKRTVVSNDLSLADHPYFNAKNLTIRIHSGHQYIADLINRTQPLAKTNFGFIITDNALATVSDAAPRKLRSNSLELSAERLELPIETRYEVFKK